MRPEDDWRGVPVCVTGGTGFLGYHLVRALVDAGARVRVLALPSRLGHPLLSERDVDLCSCDVRDADAVRAGVRGCAVIFHAAGPVATWGPAAQAMVIVHREGTRNVLAAADADATVVHVSSVVAIGATAGAEPLDETSPFDASLSVIDYVRAKREAELLALEAAAKGRRVVVVNPGYLFGPDDHERSIMGALCRRFWKGQLLLRPTNGINAVDVRDVARGHLLAAKLGRSGERYVLGGVNLSYRKLIRALADAAGMRPRGLVPMPPWALRGLACAAEWRAVWTGREPFATRQAAELNRLNWFVHSDKARRELGYEARPLAQTLRDTYQWYRQKKDLRLNTMTRWWLRAAG